jgi:hypothetical protein
MGRKLLSLFIGVIVVFLGATGIYLFFVSAYPLPGPILLAAISTFAFGCAMVWEDLGRVFLGKR